MMTRGHIFHKPLLLTDSMTYSLNLCNQQENFPSNQLFHSSTNIMDVPLTQFAFSTTCDTVVVRSGSEKADAAGPVDPAAVLYSHFNVTSLVCSGGFGSVYLATDRDHHKFAIKVQKHNSRAPMLKHELTIFQRLLFDPRTSLPSIGVPRAYKYLVLGNHEFLVMERLGDSLYEKVEALPSKTFSKKTGLMIGIQVVRRLQLLHENHVLHRDIKPDNLVMGLGAADQTVHIIDFGISHIVENWDEYNPDAERIFAGTMAYAPVEALFEKNPTRAGDLQSLVYTLIDLVTGDLGWQSHDQEFNRPFTRTEIGINRLKKKPAELCKNFPELTEFVKLVFRIKKKDTPKYDMLVQELETALASIGCQNDGQFDWDVDQGDSTTSQTVEQPEIEQGRPQFIDAEMMFPSCAEQSEDKMEGGTPHVQVETPDVDSGIRALQEYEGLFSDTLDDCPTTNTPQAKTPQVNTAEVNNCSKQVSASRNVHNDKRSIFACGKSFLPKLRSEVMIGAVLTVAFFATAALRGTIKCPRKWFN